MPAWLPFATLAADFIGGALDRREGRKGVEEQNRWNRGMAREQMDFQRQMATSAEAFSERMANTQVQRRVADLRAAGLNPALAYEGSAAAPAGVMAGGATAHMENVTSGGLSYQAMKQSINQAKAAIENTTRQTNSSIETNKATAKAAEAAARKADAEADHTRATQPHDVRRLELQNIFLDLGITGAENDAELEKKIAGMGVGGSKTIMQAIRAIFRPR